MRSIEEILSEQECVDAIPDDLRELAELRSETEVRAKLQELATVQANTTNLYESYACEQARLALLWVLEEIDIHTARSALQSLQRVFRNYPRPENLTVCEQLLGHKQ